jgi:hypothetical protein
MDVISDNKENKTKSDKAYHSHSLNKNDSLKIFIFGSWGTNFGTKGPASLSDFLLSLSSIKKHNTPPHIPIPRNRKVLDVVKSSEGYFANLSLDFNLDGNELYDSNPLESMKYNLRPRSKDTFIFPRKVARGYVSLKRKSLNPIKGKKTLHVHGLKTSVFKNHTWEIFIVDRGY